MAWSSTAGRHRRNGAAKPSYAARADAILSGREQRMADIRSLRRHGSRPAGFVRKAETLLTSGWSKATWRSRESILRTVDWLLRMELAQRRADGADPGPGHGGPRCDLRR